ncbi:MAG: hypothetical protein ACI87N_001468 [Flavobacteriales bacterium]|jgi:hypothetical protein|tara:strand:+ start:1415 stop:2422 length:1008 start_codon:yes stop_codon:yes gene_type:complete
MQLLARENISSHPILKSITQAYNIKPENCFNIKSFIGFLKLLISKKSRYLIISDPLIYILSKIFKSSSKVIFFSLELFEHQLPSKSFKEKIRHKVFFIAHRMALNGSNFVIFPNKVRLRYYLFNKILKNKNYLVVENLPSKEVLNEINKLNDFSKKELKDVFFQKFSIPNKFTNKKIMVYAGSLSVHRGIPNIVKMIEKSNEWLLIIAGNDKDCFFKNHDYKNLIFLGFINKKDSLKLVKIADVQFSNYSNDLVNTRYCAPVKVYESIALKTPFYVNKNYGVESLSIKTSIIYYENFNELNDIDKEIGELFKPVIPEIFDNYEENLFRLLKFEKC